MASPKVSIVIGAYNCEEFIQATIQSVIDQTFKDWELIIVDDGSDDNTSNKINEIDDSRIKLIRLDRNSGLPAVSRNVGVKVSKGEFIAFLDHDDLWLSDKLRIQLEYLEKKPEIVLISGLFKIKSLEKRYNNTIIPAKKNEQSGYSHNQLLISNFIASSTVIVRVTALQDIGNFDEDPGMACAEDWDLWLRIAKKYEIAFIPKIFGFYRVHNFNSSTAIKRLQKALFVIDKHLNKGWINEKQADRAKANFYFREAWFWADKDIALSKSLFYKALDFGRGSKRIYYASNIGLILSMFPLFCRFFKNKALDKKIISRIFNPHNL